MTMAAALPPDNIEGPQLMPLHRWKLTLALDFEIVGIERVGAFDDAQWAAVDVPFDDTIEVVHPTLDAPYYALIVMAPSQRTAYDTILAVMQHFT